MKGESKRSWRKGFDKARTAFACVLTDVLFGRRFHVVIPIEMPLVPKMGTYPRKLSRIDSSSHIITGILRSEEHTSELQSLMRISYAVFCLKKKKTNKIKQYKTRRPEDNEP